MVLAQHLLNYSKIKSVFNKELLSESEFAICTNSRLEKEGDCFLAIVGEVHDGFKFIGNLKKIKVCVYQSSAEKDNIASKIKGITLISVDSMEKFIFHLCHEHSERCFRDGVKTIAISGSNGKTTTKEMIKHFLTEIDEPYIATLKNDNNHFGVPFTMFRVSPEKHKVVVLEYGSNHPGEMKQLCDITYPSLGVTTNIGYTHMEFFDELEDVFKEESKIFHRVYGLTDGSGLFLINNDDEFLKNLTSKGCRTFGTGQAQIKYSFNGSTVEFNGMKLENSNIIGDYNFINLGNAFELTLSIFPEKKEELIRAAKTFKSTNNRSQWLDWESKKVFLDAYNANPSSMEVAIKSYVDHIGSNESVLILGQMNELGSKSKNYHKELGEFTSKFSVDVIYVGQFFEQFREGIDRNIKHFESVENVDWKSELATYKNVFAKASRSLQLEKIFDITKH